MSDMQGNPATAGRIFISYRREDSSGQAGRLSDDLTDSLGPGEVMIDVSSLRGGDKYPDVLRAQIRRADVVLAVIGPRWAGAEATGHRRIDDAEDWVRVELTEALASNRPVIPVQVGGAPFPPSSLPPDLAPIAQLEAIEVSDSRWRYDVGRLLDLLDQQGIKRAPWDPFPGEPPASRVEVRKGWLVTADESKTWEQVAAFLSANQLRSSDRIGDRLSVEGGSKSRSRLFGLWLSDRNTLPLKGSILVKPLGARTMVGVLLRENFGAGVMDGGSRQKYELRLASIADGLRQATS